MVISGFSFARNADTLGYPVVESIRSVLPVCDEFVIAVGRGDPGDRTRELVASIGDPKIRIIDTEWRGEERLGGNVLAAQTDIALHACSGDWCFYIQADEAVHEQYHDTIRRRCRQLLGNRRVEGLLFTYRHFWGDYDHYLVNHRWYPAEIRIVRNRIGVRSWGDAQSFRLAGRKLRVAALDAEIYHYGWVRDPRSMGRKKRAFDALCRGPGSTAGDGPEEFDYGSLEKLPRFAGTHPAVMHGRIAAMDWRDRLQYSGPSRVRHTHDRLKYRLLTYIEQRLLNGRQIGGYKNYRLIKGI